MQQSTKPYIYYEQIINGLVNVPKKIQEYLGEAILVRNEKQRIEMEKQKEEAEAKRLSLVEEEEPKEENTTSSNSLFKLPLFGWFSSDKQATDKQADKEPSPEDVEKRLDQEPPSEDVEKIADQEPASEDVEKSLDQEPASEDVEKIADKEPSVQEPKTLEKCDIRKWTSKLE